MKTSLVKFLEIPVEKIDDNRLARLFRLLSFYKTDSLQPSDFDRLLEDVNPFLTACQGSVKANFQKSMGGGYATTSTHDWKFSAIQQIGLVISRNYGSIKESFDAASNQTDKVNFEKFKAFVEKHNALQGFNVTLSLMQRLFSEMDPHKKTFLNFKDWTSSFQTFNENDTIVVELKNYLQCQFTGVSSAFGYFQTYADGPLINLDIFSRAVQALIPNRRYTQPQLKYMYKSFLRDPTDFRTGFNFNHFSYEFESVKFRGQQTIVTKPNPNNRGGFVTTIKSDTNPNWEKDIITKLRSIINASGKSMQQIFADFD